VIVPRAFLPGLFLGVLAAAGLCRAQEPPPPAGETPPPAAVAPPATPPAVSTTGRILGRVTDAGKPVQAAQVRLVSRSESGLLRVTSTNQKGEYRFKELPTGTYDVEVEADGFRPGLKPGVEVKAPFQNIVDVPLSRPGTPGTLPIPPGVAGPPGQGVPGRAADPGPPAEPPPAPATVRGKLSDGDRRPVVDVSVLLVAQQGTRLYQAISGPDGAFTIDGVIPGKYRAVVRSPGHMPVDLKTVDVRPVAGLTLNLSLVDFPLNFKARTEGSPPPETPRPLPVSGNPATPPAAAPPAPPADGGD
jgi:hypothetical protein